MTGSGSGVPDRGDTPATGTARGASGGIVAVLAVGFVFRLILAYLLPGSGFRQDLDAFSFWAANLASEGPFGFYERDFFHDYTPGYLYVLWFVGLVGQAVGGIGDLIKVPAMLADVALAYVVYLLLRDLRVTERRALVGAAVVVANPITWFDSVVWGQVDSVGVVFLLLAVRELWRGRTERSAVLAVVAALIKPQLGILAPLVAAVTIRRALRPEGSWGDEAPGGPSGTAWERRTTGPVRIVTTGLAGLAAAFALCLPFGLSVVELSPTFPFVDSGLVRQILSTAAGYPYLTVNAYNPWALLTVEGSSLATNNAWICDALLSPSLAASPDAPCLATDAPPPFGQVLGIPAVLVGSAGLLAVMLVTSLVVARRPDRLTILVGLAVLALAFFVVPTRVHERYLYPFVAIGAVLALASTRWAVAYVVASIATFANLYVVLTTIYPDNPNVDDWLGIGEAIRSPTGVTIVALAHLAVFLWAVVQLRDGARATLAAEAAEAALEPEPLVGDPGAGAGVAADPAAWSIAARSAAAQRPDAPVPTRSPSPTPSPPPAAAHGAHGAATRLVPAWYRRPGMGDLGPVAWIRARFAERPVRADRSRLLDRERGGRFDRLDVWLLVVLVVATLGLRTFRLAEPPQTHFDEVYHARTGTEFLQHWRYGIDPPQIYEWTHPHLAKYAMAAGLVLFAPGGADATSHLGTPVRDAVVEPRRSDVSGERAGDRLWVVTGDELRGYDLASRANVARWPLAGASAVALDTTGPRLVVGTEAGELLTVELSLLDGWRPTAVAEPPVDPVPLATLDAPVRSLAAPDDGASFLALLDGDLVVAVEPGSGAELGRTEVPGAVELVPAGRADAVVATLEEVTDPAAVADELAPLIGRDAAELGSALEVPPPGSEATGQVVLGGVDPDARADLDAAIADGRLPGVAVEQVARIAAPEPDGVTLLLGSGALETRVPLAGGARGAALVTGIAEYAELYVTTTTEDGARPAFAIVRLDEPAQSPTILPMPGEGSRVLWDAASEMVHVLGTTPDGRGSTVYVIEPHGHAVFADNALPFAPATVLLDTAPLHPAGDRGDLIALAPDGAVATAEVGQYPFAWRMPGVIAGALTALFLYVLARVLFARRSVAVLAGVFVLVEGMLFVQSRIAMNDVYVGVFILAAYALFAVVWTGATRARWAFWALMPLVGLLLGLALASKWVAAYAIGALGILVLARSALGRVLLVLGLVALTAVLGWMAISVPPEGGAGNLTFLVIMIGLTLLAAVVSVLHPIAWSDGEVRFALGAPLALGALVAGVAAATGRVGEPVVVGPVAVSPLQVAFALGLISVGAYAAFALGGRLGFGPWAPPPEPDDPAALLEPPAPPAEGWLRLGARAGLPVAWLLASLIAVPLVVYVASYLPWAQIDDHAIVEGWPNGHAGQTLLDLTRQMYGYHDNLTEPHAASSPWWAWPLNLKPVWFHQGGYAGDTASAIYDAGNMVVWWLGVPAMAFAAYQAYRRRSLALALIVIGFACQWIPWARIDRAAFQYHYYTALPFVVLALAYFAAELWHGPSPRTWRMARIVAGLAVLGPAILWFLRLPLCAVVGVERVNPGSQACVGSPGNLEVTLSAAAMAVVGLGAGILIVRELAALGRRPPGDRPTWRDLGPLIATAIGGGALVALASALPSEGTLVSLPGIVPEVVAVFVAVPLAFVAVQVATARDARRFVVGLVLAAAAWFAILYPNIAALPLPSRLVNAYQGILPTYLYPFQFPVNTVPRGAASFTDPRLLVLVAALLLVTVVVAYAAWAWRVALAERAAESAGPPVAGRGEGYLPGG